MTGKDLSVLLEAPNALDWADFGFKVFSFLLGMGIQIVMVFVMLMLARAVWGFYTEGKHGDFPSIKVLFRRVYCRHRFLSRVKTRWGFHQTKCSSCGVDVNKAKPKEMQR